MASRIDMEVEVKSSANKFFAAMADSTFLFPRIFPELYKSIEIIEGDGKSVGTVRLITYGEGAPIAKSKTSMEKIVVADKSNKTVAYSVIDGEVLEYFKLLKMRLQVVAKGKGAVVKFCLQYDMVNDEVPKLDAIPMQVAAAQSLSDLDAYLLKN